MRKSSFVKALLFAVAFIAPITVQAQTFQGGRGGTGAVSSVNGRIGAITVTSSDVTTALGFTPPTNARTITAGTGLTGGGDLTANRTIALAAIAADSLLLNNSGISAVPGAVAFPSCSGAASALIYNTSTHAIGCNSITAGAATLTNNSSPISGGTTTRILYNNAGTLSEYSISGSGTTVAMATSPSLTTPTLGVASATSINKVVFTAPASAATLTIVNNKTLTVNNTLAFSGTDSSTLNIGTGGTLAAAAFATLSGNTTKAASVAAGSLVSGDVVTFDASGNIQDAGYVPAANGIGAVIATNGTTTSPTASQFNINCPLYTVNATTAIFNIPQASALQSNGGCLWISNPSANTYALHPFSGDNLNGAPSNVTEPANSLIVVTTDGAGTFAPVPASSGGLTTGGSTIASGTNTRVLFNNSGVLGEYTISGTGNVAMTTSPSFTTPTLGVASATSINKVVITTPASSATLTILNGKTFTVNNTLTFAGTDSTTITTPSTNATMARTDAGQVFTGQQSNSVTPLSVATTTFTPTGVNNNYSLTLVTACATACTIANPSATPVAGTAGVFIITQFASGGKTLTWGSSYVATGGTSTVQPDTNGSSINVVSYYVVDSTHILISLGGSNAVH